MIVKNMLMFIWNWLKQSNTPKCLKQDIKPYFNKLTRMEYEPHPTYNIPPDQIFNYKSSDCEDRSLALAHHMKTLGCQNIELIKMFWNTPTQNYGHMAVEQDNKIFDATARNNKGEYIYFNYPYQEYIETFKFNSIFKEPIYN